MKSWHVTQSEADEMKALYESGKTPYAIGPLVDRAPSTVRTLRSRNWVIYSGRMPPLHKNWATIPHLNAAQAARLVNRYVATDERVSLIAADFGISERTMERYLKKAGVNGTRARLAGWEPKGKGPHPTLSPETIAQMAERRRSTGLSFRKLALEFGVSEKTAITWVGRAGVSTARVAR